jgi:hypothetical protein
MYICICEKKDTTPSKRFFLIFITTHVLNTVVFAVKMLFCAIDLFSPLQVKNTTTIQTFYSLLNISYSITVL